MATILPPLAPVQMLAVYRARYPEGLVCTRCARLLSTRRPRVTEAERLAYVCAECRWEQQEAARAAASRALAARDNLAHARAARGVRGRIQPRLVSVVSPRSDARNGAGLRDRVSIPRAAGLRAAARRLRPPGGRPQKHDSTAIALREARRAYRARQRALTPAPAV
jgi:hypothetical protein